MKTNHFTNRISVAVLSFLLLTASFTGCAGKTDNAGTTEASKETETTVTTVSEENTTSEIAETEEAKEPVTITYVSGQDETGALEKIIEAFEAKYEYITIDLQELPGNSDDIKKSISTSLAAESTTPDVFGVDIIWVSQFAAAGWLLDVTEEVSEISDEFLAGPLLTTEYDNKNYAFPNYTDVGLLYYRSDIISTPPTTWDELVELSKEYIGTNGIEYGYVFQAYQGEPVVCNALEFIKQNGGQDLVDGEFVLDSQNTIDALNFIIELIDTGISPEGVLTHKPEDTRAIFEEGKALFMRNWTYAYALSQAETSKVAGKVGVTTLPVGPDGTSSSGTVGGWNTAINSRTEHPEEAKLFAEFLSSAEAQKIRTILASTFPTNKAVYDDAEVNKALPYLSDLVEAFDESQPRPQVTDYSAISTILQEYLHKALTKELPVDTAVEELNNALNTAYKDQIS